MCNDRMEERKEDGEETEKNKYTFIALEPSLDI